MKINPESLQNTTSSSTTNATKSTSSSTNQSSEKAVSSFSAGSGDQIQISELSRRLHAFESSLATASDFNANKVEEIKQAISAGKFTVNPGAVADNLLSSVQELLARQQQ